MSALAILNREVEANALANQVAIIGVTGVGLTDVVATPVAALMDGVEVQAQAIENMLDGTRLVRPLLAPWLELGLFLSVAAVLMVVRAASQDLALGWRFCSIAAGVLITASLIELCPLEDALGPVVSGRRQCCNSGGTPDGGICGR